MPEQETIRFEKKREDIIQAATSLLNDNGVKGMTYIEIAAKVGLNTTSVTYYFRRKEQLAIAVYEATLDRLEAMAEEALAQPTPEERVRHWIDAHIDERQAIREGRVGRIAVLSEIRTLAEEAQAPLLERYRGIFARVREFFPKGATTDAASHHRAHALNTARALILVEAVYWLPAWTPRYSHHDFPRLKQRMFELLAQGLAKDGATWNPAPLPNRAEWRTNGEGTSGSTGGAGDDFLRVATRLINERGYRGASVNRIAAELNVTKGSFYHHHDAKDDLVQACFERSYNRVAAAQLNAIAMSGDYWTRLSSLLAELADLQFFDPMPLLRTTALHAMPGDERVSVIDRANRLAKRFAGMVIDGMCEGSVRAIDPLIASQVMMSTINPASEMGSWSTRFADPKDAVATYCWTLCYGLFRDPPNLGDAL